MRDVQLFADVGSCGCFVEPFYSRAVWPPVFVVLLPLLIVSFWAQRGTVRVLIPKQQDITFFSIKPVESACACVFNI